MKTRLCLLLFLLGAALQAPAQVQADHIQPVIEEVIIQPVVPVDHTRTLDNQALLHLLISTKDWGELTLATAEALRRKLPGACSVLIERLPDFPEKRVALAQLIFSFKVRAAVEPAREWLQDDDVRLRFWGALLLVRDGDRAKAEGFAELTALLQHDDQIQFYPDAIDTLVARKDEPALALACGILKKPKLGTDFHYEPIIFQLLLTTRPEVLEYLLMRLDDQQSTTGITGPWDGHEVTRKIFQGDVMARTISEWRNDGWSFSGVLSPDADRAQQREELKAWLKEQFIRLRAGDAVPFRTLQGVRNGEGKVPVP